VTKLAKRLVSPDLVCPDHYAGPDWVLTDGPAVSELLASANFAPDPQQALALDMIFAVGANGRPASFSFCVICCRQNLKTGLFKQCAIGWLYVTCEHDIVWSAHEMSTTLASQAELGEIMLGSPSLSRLMLKQKNNGIYSDNGSERIELSTGQKIRFKARTNGGGRGLSGDKVILDESFALKPSHVGSLLPTMMARPSGQVVYGSSAGKADSVVLRDVRDRGRVGASPRLSYLEWCAEKRDCADPECRHPKDAAARDLGCALDDEELWRKANPTITTGRISIQTIADMRQELPPEEFARECLGWWDEVDDLERALPGWTALGKDDPESTTVLGLGVASDPDQTWCSLSAVVEGEEHPHLSVADRRRATDRKAFAAEVARIQAKYGCAVRIRGKNFLIPDLEAAGVALTLVDLDEFAQASADLATAVAAGEVEHSNYPELDAAVAIAKWRELDGRRVFDSRKGDISTLEAAALALRGASVAATTFFASWR
jgi:hypothetical protein